MVVLSTSLAIAMSFLDRACLKDEIRHSKRDVSRLLILFRSGNFLLLLSVLVSESFRMVILKYPHSLFLLIVARNSFPPFAYFRTCALSLLGGRCLYWERGVRIL